MAQNNQGGLYIRESIGGVPLEPAKSSVKEKRESRKTSETVVTTIKSDPYIWGIYLMLVLISIIELYSASATEVVGTNVYAPLLRHGMFLGIGFVLLYMVQRTHYVYITRFAGLIGVLSWLALAYSTFMGVEINGAQRAFMLGPFTVQPPEIVKLTVVICLAAVLAKSQLSHDVKTSGIVYSALIVAAFGGLLALNGLTNTLLVMVVSVSMFLICGIPVRKIMIVIGVYAVLFGMFYVCTKVINRSSEFDKVGQTEEVVDAGGGDHSLGSQTQINRVVRFLRGVHPEDELTDENRQVIMAKFAQARGGVVGKGLGNSRESVRLPLAFSDYIYSIVIEESGLIGGIILMILYLLLLARAGYVAYNLTRALPAFLILGCAILIVFQALVHMAIVTGLFPVSGQPLPLISKGGTSVLVMSVAIGIMLSVSRYATRQKEGKSARDNVEAQHLGSDMNAINATADN
ncbi:MAG: FtsW/RodA/SpoVE family cell cycle protein [Muribaculaceae bacterium]|nr:FtsW/RodA/SpoVE family cell cycle protein [Muribaculaceae bacterium]